MINYYQCPECQTLWEDVWDCACNDECPNCGIKDIEPYDSRDESEGKLSVEDVMLVSQNVIKNLSK